MAINLYKNSFIATQSLRLNISSVKMNKIIMAFAVIAIIALVMAIVSLGLAFTVLSEYHPANSPSPISTQTPTLTPTPASSTQSTPTNAFNPTLTGETINFNELNTTTTTLYVVSIAAHNASNGTSVSYSDVTILPGNSYNYLGTSSNGTVILSSNSVNNRLIGNYTFNFGVTLTNPTISVNSSQPYEIQFIVTEVDATAASSEDVGLAVFMPATNAEAVMFGAVANDYYSPLTANVSANTLTYTCNPSATLNQQVSGGSIIASGFDEYFGMQISFGITGTFNLAVNLVPAT